MKIFIVIPVYNEEKHIGSVLSEIRKEKLPIIVIDDGSSDDSKVKIQNAKTKFKIKNLTVLKHRINLGKGAAMKTGAEAAFALGAEAIIFMDSDGQHDPANLQAFVENLKKHEFVVGSRNLSYGVPLVRYLGNKFASLLVSQLFGLYVSDLLCGYRGITKAAYKKLYWKSGGYGVETEMIVRAALAGVKVKEVNVSTKYHDAHKGVTIMDAINILFDVVLWRIEAWF